VSFEKKLNFKKQSEGYTPMHISRSDQEEHVSFKGEEHMVHVYGEDLPWPMGTTQDKWFSKRKGLLTGIDETRGSTP